MSNVKIYSWLDIAKYYSNGGLILGNGASMALDAEHFSYKSILDKARNLGHITPALTEVFKLLDTSDFEHVLQGLWQTKYINEALGVSNPKITEAYNDIKYALIETVRSIHENVPYDTVLEPLKVASDFMSQFKTVLSLNYDVLAYWSILIGNDQLGKHFSDCFVDKKFQHNWENFRNYYGTLIFYPHGNLILGRDLDGVEYKIHTEDTEMRRKLVAAIIQIWDSGKLAPVFVSEGYSEKKLVTIDRSPYLSTVYRQIIPKIERNVVIYGWSLSDQDNHLVKAILEGPTRRFAISVHRSTDQHEEKCSKIEKKLDGFEVVFFDSKSKGCWICHQ